MIPIDEMATGQAQAGLRGTSRAFPIDIVRVGGRRVANRKHGALLLRGVRVAPEVALRIMRFMPWTLWEDRFGVVLPLGHAVRAAFADRWFRIHSLADSKRYAEDDEERSALLKRQHVLAREVLGEHSACFIVVPRYEMIALGSKRTVKEFLELEFVCVRQVQENDREMSFLVAESLAAPASMEKPLLAIADDKERALWLNPATGEVFAPYDGGVDVICATPARRDLLAARFRDWLSPRPDGL